MPSVKSRKRNTVFAKKRGRPATGAGGTAPSHYNYELYQLVERAAKLEGKTFKEFQKEATLAKAKRVIRKHSS